MVDFGNLGVRSASDPKRTSLGEFGDPHRVHLRRDGFPA
jgi:hypothetical protein